MKTIGIIGGLGPETTAHFYLDLVFSYLQKQVDTRPSILMWNVPISIKVEEEFITKTKGQKVYVSLLVDAAKRLERGGADFIVIPCNSVHLFIDEVRSSVNIPVLSIIEETSDFLVKNNFKKIGMVATSITLRKKLYEKEFLNKGILVESPNSSDQNKMGKIISKLVNNKYSESDGGEISMIIDKLVEKKVDVVLLACTDLQLLVTKHKKITVVDTMKILVDATIRDSLK